MSRLLVLGAGQQARRWSRLLTNRSRSSARRAPSACEALLVVNDHSANSVADLQQALELRRQRPGLPVAVLTLVDPTETDTQVIARALSTDSPKPTSRLNAEQGEALLQVLVSGDGLNFEFQGRDMDPRLQ